MCIQNIVEAGYEKEVSKLRTSATSLKVFDTMLSSILDELIGADDTEFDEIAPCLVVKQRQILISIWVTNILLIENVLCKTRALYVHPNITQTFRN